MAYKDIDRRREYGRRWVADRRKAFFQDKSCVRCGSTQKLELDHIDPQLKKAHRIWTWSQKRREAELANCQVLCHDCHLEKSIKEDWPATRGYDPTKHGLTMYQKRKCRCDTCRAANRERVRSQRAAAKRRLVQDVVPFPAPADDEGLFPLPKTG